MNYLVINSPIYGAIYALEKELSNERKRVEQIINSSQVEYTKSNLKPRLLKSKVDDLLTMEKDKKKLCNTLREFYGILYQDVRSAHFELQYTPLHFKDEFIIERKKREMKHVTEEIKPVHPKKLFDRKAKPRVYGKGFVNQIK
jgi:hypothetical protein